MSRRVSARGGFVLRCVLAAAFAAGCARQAVNANRPSIERWLLCDECDRGEREAVVALGNGAVRPLDAILRRIPPEWVTNLRVQYGASARQAGVADTAAYVQRYVSNFVATVQSRAAHALGDIHTPAAVRALDEALQDSASRGYRADVIRDLERSRRVAASDRFLGSWTPVVPRFLDTVWVRRPGGAAWDGDETVSLAGAPFPNDLGAGFRSARAELGVIAAALPGAYALSIANVGAANTAEVSVLQVGAFPGAPPVETDVSSGPLPATFLRGATLGSSRPLNTFRIQPGAALPLTATLDWSGLARVDLVWDDCRNHADARLTPRSIAGVVIAPTGAPVPGVQVSLAGLPLAVISDSAGRFRIGNVPRGWTGQVLIRAIGFTPQSREAWEGASSLQVVLGSATTSRRVRAPSPSALRDTVPAQACRLLRLVRSDTARAPAIVRLRITTP